MLKHEKIFHCLGNFINNFLGVYFWVHIGK